MPLPYRQVSDIYNSLVDAGVVWGPQAGWSARMNTTLGTDAYTEGLSDNWVKRASTWIDRALEKTPLPDWGEQLGRAVGGAVGAPDTGAEIGHGLPRMLVDFAPLAIPGLGEAGAAAKLGLGALRYGGTAALSGAGAYTQTGNPVVGAIAGLTNAVMPETARLAEQFLLRKANPALATSLSRLVSNVEPAELARRGISSDLLPQSGLQALSAFGTGQLAAAGLGEASSALQAGVDPNVDYEFHPVDTLLNLTLGQLPFAAIHGAKTLVSGRLPSQAPVQRERIAQAESALTAGMRARDAAQSSDTSLVPTEADLIAAETVQGRIAELQGKRKALEQTTDAEGQQELDKVNEELALLARQSIQQTQGKAVDLGGLPIVPTPASPYTDVVGQDFVVTKKSGGLSAHFTVADTPENIAAGFTPGDRIRYSRPVGAPAEEVLPNGQTKIRVPVDFHSVVDDSYARNKPQLAQQNPDLFHYFETHEAVPEQLTALRDEWANMQDAENALAEASGPQGSRAKFEDATRLYNAARVDAGLAPRDAEFFVAKWRAKLRADRQATLEQTVQSQVSEDKASAVTKLTLEQQQQKADEKIQQVLAPLAAPNPSEEALTWPTAVKQLREGSKLDTGRFNRLFAEWDETQGHKLESVEAKRESLTSFLSEAQRSGKGKRKENVLNDPAPEVQVVAKPLRSAVLDLLGRRVFSEEVTDPEVERAWEAWSKHVEEGLAVPQALLDDERVRSWNDQYEEMLAKATTSARAPALPERRFSAGEGFLYSTIPLEGNRIGKHTIPKSGIVSVIEFKNIAKGGTGPLPDVEIEVLQRMVPEAFQDVKNEGGKWSGRVDVPLLNKLLPERQAVTKTEVYGMEGKPSEAKNKRDAAAHLIDSWSSVEKQLVDHLKASITDPNINVENILVQLSPVKQEIAKQYIEASRTVSSEPPDTSPRATSFYQSISPFDTTKYPVIRVDVVLPQSKAAEDNKKAWVEPGSGLGRILTNEEAGLLWPPDTIHEQLPNTLGWVMAQVVPGQDGRPVMFIGEMQSRWLQERYKEQQLIRQFDSTVKIEPKLEGNRYILSWTDLYGDTRTEIAASSPEQAIREVRKQLEKTLNIPGHPLLDTQHILALKAAVREARSRGIDTIVISDAQTAMKTEMHDTQARQTVLLDKGQSVPEHIIQERTANGIVVSKSDADAFALKGKLQNEVLQEGGMVVHYDTTGPSTLAKLTGEKGTPWRAEELHKNIQPLRLQDEAKILSGPYKTEGEAQGWFNENNSQGVVAKFPFTGPEQNKKWYVFSESPQAPIKGSPVFTENGKPKTSITGLAFDISKLPREFTLGEASRAPATFVPEGPADVQTIKDRHLDQGVPGALQFLDEAQEPFFKHWANVLRGFPQALDRLQLALTDEGSRYTQHLDTLFVGRGILDTDPTTARFILAHELGHAIGERAIRDPNNAELVANLDGLRQRMVEGLPKALRETFNKLQSEDFFGRWQRGEASEAEFLATHADDASRRLLYALSSPSEFFTGGFTDHDVQRFMAGAKAEKGTIWQKFTSWVRELFHLGIEVKDTALEEFLHKGYALAQRGEAILSFEQYGQRYLENKGIVGREARQLVRRATGTILHIDRGATPESIVDLLTLPTLDPTSKVGAARARVEDLRRRDPEFKKDVDGLTNELGLDHWSDIGTSAVRDGLDIADAVDLLPGAVTRHVFTQVGEMQSVLDVIRAATKDKVSGLVDLSNPKEIGQPVKEVLARVASVMAQRDRIGLAEAQVEQMQAMDPRELFQRLGVSVRAPATAADVILPREAQRGWWANLLEPMHRIAVHVPQMQEALLIGMNMQSTIKNWHTDVTKFSAWDLDEGKVTDAGVKRMKQTFENPKLSKAVNAWIAANNQEGNKASAVDLLPLDHPSVKPILAKLTESERSAAHDSILRSGSMNEAYNLRRQNARRESFVIEGAQMLVKADGMTTDKAIGLTGELFDVLLNPDPQAQAVKLQAVQQQINPQTMISLWDMMQSSSAQWKLWQDHGEKNRYWVSASRQEKYNVAWRDSRGKTQLWQASSEEEGKRYVKEKGGTVVEIYERVKRDGESPDVVWGTDSGEVIAKVQEIEQRKQALRAKLGLPQDTDPIYQELARSAKAQGQDVPVPKRKLDRGFEELPLAANQVAYFENGARYWSRKLFQQKLDLLKLSPDVASRPDIVDTIDRYSNAVLTPDTEFGKTVQRLMVGWHMGWQLASPMVNLTQPLTTHVAEMTRKTGNTLGAYRRVMGAFWSVAKSWTLKGNKFDDPLYQWANDRAIRDGVFSTSMFDPDGAVNDTAQQDLGRVLSKNKYKTVGQQLQSALGWYSQASLMFFRWSEKINNMVGFHTGFQYEYEQQRAKGLSDDRARQVAYDSARIYNASVNYTGGKVSRPIGLYDSNSPTLRSAAMTMSSLQGYVLGSTFQMLQYIREGFLNAPGVTPGEKYAARKALGVMAGTQLAMAGVLGLPFVAGALALIEQTTGLQINKTLRETVHNLLDDDDESGGLWSQIAMTGAPSLAGWDFQSRLSLGNSLPGVSELNGFQPEAALGPVSGLLSSLVRGGYQLREGQAPVDWVPPVLRKLVKLGVDGGVLRDYKDRPLIEPTEGELAGLALGFSPTRLSQANAASRIVDRAETAVNREESSFRQQMASEALQGNFGTVQNRVIGRRQQFGEGYNVSDAMHAIAKAAEEQTFIRDLRREGTSRTADAQRAVLGTFPLEASQPSESQRLEFRQNMLAQLGVRATSTSDVRTAQIMDELRRQQPEATRMELKRAAEKVLRGQGL